MEEKRMTSNKKVKYEDILKLPKCDLHVHLDGSLRIPTIIELANEYKVKLPSVAEEELRKYVSKDKGCLSLVDYLEAFDITLKVMQEKDALVRTTYELVEDSALENVKYLEIRFSPILHQARGLKLTEIVDAVIEGCQMAEKKYDITTGIIICGMRHVDPIISLRLAELAVAYKNKKVCGFDLAGAEANFPAKDHKEAFFLILNNNINCTLHAGEAYGPESISQAVHYCGAHRIGHGTRLKENGDLLNYINDHRIPLEICPTSNLHTRSVDKIENHPLKFYYEFGLRVTINTDNRLVSNTTMTKELHRLSETFGFSLDDIKTIITHSFKSAFLGYKDKNKLLDKVLPLMDRKRF